VWPSGFFCLKNGRTLNIQKPTQVRVQQVPTIQRLWHAMTRSFPMSILVLLFCTELGRIRYCSCFLARLPCSHLTAQVDLLSCLSLLNVQQQKEVVTLARNFEQNLSSRSSAGRQSTSSCWGSGFGIPRFFYPNGKPPTAKQLQERLDKIIAFFSPIADRLLNRSSAGQLCVACSLPVYWKEPLFSLVSGGKSHLSAEQFIDFWKK
jgi:hypothetical protein